MRNPYFRFKQFTIQQGNCAMKVGTDGVLLGAIAPVEQAKSILDIGTGTGLLALMLAQRCPTASIDAIEIDEAAAAQARENVAESPWKHICVVHSSLQDYQTANTYQLIVSNPPYFVDSLKAPNANRNLARHTDSLSFTDLLQGVAKLLHPDGSFWVILPHNETERFQQLAMQVGLFVYHKIHVYPRADKPAKRIVMGFCKSLKAVTEENLTIENEQRHDYTPAFAQLTAPFYLD